MIKKTSQFKLVKTLFILIMSILVLSSYAQKKLDLIHYDLGIKYRESAKFEESIEEFRKMLTIYPNHVESYKEICRAWRGLGKPALGIFNAKKGLKFDPENKGIHLEIARAYKANGELEQSLLHYRKYLDKEKDPAKKSSVEKEIVEVLDENNKGREPGKEVLSKESKQSDSSDDIMGNVDEDTNKKVSSKKTPTKKINEIKAGVPKNKDVLKLSSSSKHSDITTDPLLKDVVKYYNNGEYGKAMKAVHVVLKKKPGHSGAYYYGGVIRKYNNQPQKAEVNFKKAFSYPDKGYNAHYFLGRIYEDSKRFADAVKSYENYMNLTTLQKGKNEAKRRISRLLPKISKSAKTESYVKKDYGPKKAFKFPIDDILVYIIEDTLSIIGKRMLTSFDLFADSSFDPALNLLKKISRDNPGTIHNDNCMFNTGLIYIKLRLWNKAINSFNKILKNYPKGDVAKPALVLKGHAFAGLGNVDSTKYIYKRYIKKFPKDKYLSFINTELGNLEFQRNDFNKAASFYKRALSTEKSSARKIFLNYKIGECYKQEGDNSRSIRYFKQVTMIKSSLKNRYIKDAYLRLGDNYFKVRDLKTAKKYYNKMLTEFPEDSEGAWATYQLANIYKKGRRFEKAIELYRKVVSSYPDSYWSVHAKWNIEDAIWENTYKDVLK